MHDYPELNSRTTHTDAVELRRYTLVPGRRDDLIDLFDRHLVAPQEQGGMHVVGQFRDLDDPDAFVWLRGFDSVGTRAEALAAFYYGPVWAEHRAAANTTMVDSDDVHLLRPTYVGADYPVFGRRSAPAASDSLVCVTVVPVAPDAETTALLSSRLVAALRGTGDEPLAILATHEAENGFPALPVRSDPVVVWINRFDGRAQLDEHLDRLNTSTPWHREVLPTLAALGAGPLTRFQLVPTSGSQLR